MTRLYLDHIFPHHLEKKTLVRVGPPLTKLSGSAHTKTRMVGVSDRFLILKKSFKDTEEVKCSKQKKTQKNKRNSRINIL